MQHLKMAACFELDFIKRQDRQGKEIFYLRVVLHFTLVSRPVSREKVCKFTGPVLTDSFSALHCRI